MAYYSKSQTRFFVDPRLEIVSNRIVNLMGDTFILEGAIYNNYSNGKNIKIWYRNLLDDNFVCKCKCFSIDASEEQIKKIIAAEPDMIFMGKKTEDCVINDIIDVEVIEESKKKNNIENKHDDAFEFVKL